MSGDALMFQKLGLTSSLSVAGGLVRVALREPPAMLSQPLVEIASPLVVTASGWQWPLSWLGPRR